MATRQENCKWCGAQLFVLFRTQNITCPWCHTVNRYIVEAMPPYNGYNNTNTTGVYNYYSNSGMPGNGYYQKPLSVSPLSAHGRKRAVLCGLSYYGHKQSLKGSINDVRNMQDFLVKRLGFPNASVLVLTEEERDLNRIPTRYNMTVALRWLVDGCRSGDSLVFYYSGHASQVKDQNGDEIDGYDEALCPVDYKNAGKILDDEINATIVRPLPHGAKLHAIIDTCCSGTVLDLSYMCRMSPEGYYSWNDQWIPRGGCKGTNGGIAISLSACDDNQMSGDTTAFTGNATGAMTYSFINVLANEPRVTYGHLLVAMRNKVHGAQKGVRQGGPFSSPSLQEPQLSSSHKFDIYKMQFTM